MKILIISDAWHPQVNGVVRTYEYLCHELQAMGHEIKVISPADFRYKIPMPGYFEIKLCLLPHKKLSRLIRGFKPDMIHIPVEGPLGWAAKKYCQKNNLEFSTSYHTHFPHYVEERIPSFLPFLRKYGRALGRWYVRKFHKGSSALMVASPSLEHVLRSWGFENNIQRLTRGVNTETFYLDQSVNTLKDINRPIALYVGRIAVEKNLEAFLKMPWKGTKIIVGSGPSKFYLKTKYPHVLFLGKKSGKELGDIYRSADVFVFPSRTDTFGIVVIEALACGVPVAAYDVTGPKDIITEDYLGCLNADLSVAATRAMANANAQKCADHVETYFNWRLAAQQFIDYVE